MDSASIVASWIRLRICHDTYHVHHNFSCVRFHAYFVLFHLIFGIQNQAFGLQEPEAIWGWASRTLHLKPSGSSVHAEAHPVDRVLGIGHLVGRPPWVRPVFHLHLQVARDNGVRAFNDFGYGYSFSSWENKIISSVAIRNITWGWSDNPHLNLFHWWVRGTWKWRGPKCTWHSQDRSRGCIQSAPTQIAMFQVF